MAVPLDKFVQQLEDSGILTGDTLKDFLPPKGEPKDAEELARELVRQKKLTKFQAEEVSKGKGKSLVLGNYVLMEKIGAGGMGQVFKARHQRMDRLVAVKLLPAAMTKDTAAIARFEREVKAAAKLRHPNIIATDDADQANGVHFLVMELVEGSDLSALIKRDGPFPVDKAVNYVLQAAKGLEFAHKKGVVHRDIKPANLLLDSEGTVKILDMGLARIHGEAGTQAELTATGAVMGTVDYMAPEQALSTKTADARADIYSLGCSLYYLLTARATYDGDTLMAKLLAHRDQPIPELRTARPEVPKPLEVIFKRMVAKKIEDRYQSMTEVISALESCSLAPSETLALKSAEVEPTPRLRDKSVSSRTLAVPPPAKEVAVKSNAPSTRQVPESSADVTSTDFLDDLPSSATKSLRTKKRPSKKGKNAFQKDQKKLLLIGAAVLGVLILLAGVMVTLRTKDGKLIITVNEPDAEVEVLNEKDAVEITRKGEKGPITISVVPGKHRLRVQKDGFELFSDSFEIKSGGTTSITAKLVPLDGKPALAETKPTVIQKSSSGVEGEWRPLFDGKSLAGWTGDVAVMSVENGVLVNDGKRGIVNVPDNYADVEIEVEFRLADGGNSGLGICYSGSGDPAHEGLEIQMLDDEKYPDVKDAQKCGSIYMLAAAKPGHFKRWPDWNQFRVTSSGNDVRVELNGVPVAAATRTELKQTNSNHAGVLRTSGKVCLVPHTGRSEYRNFRVRPARPTMLLTGNAPPKDATVFNGHSYKFFSDVLDWKQAKARCGELGGHLAIIESDAENNFVVALAQKSIPVLGEYDGVWIGATDEHQEGDWKWINGNPLTFTKWNAGQPNNKQNAEHFMLLWIKPGEWCDQPIQSSQHKTYFICEWDAAPRDASSDSAGWVSLFNGRNLEGWKPHPDDSAKWEVKDGVLIGSGPDVGHLFSQRDDYENFHFKVEAKISDGGNGGQYFRTRFEKSFPHGYEAQINSNMPDIKTGSLYGFKMVPATDVIVPRPDEWFTQEVIARGNHIVILVNGKTAVDYVDAAKTHLKGHMALQHNRGFGGKETVVQFRRIEVKELPRENP